MTCRHSDRINNPECSSYRTPGQQLVDQEEAIRDLKKQFNLGDTPDASNYDVEDMALCGGHLVLKVKYPSCANCAYEGNKVLVYLNVTVLDLIKWKRIDPHFRAPGPTINGEAPSPAARFPASDDGWRDAIAYAQSKSAPNHVMRGL